MHSDILVPIGFFAMLAAIFVLPAYFRSRERLNLQDTLRTAYQNGQPVPQEVIDALTSEKAPPDARAIRDIRTGVILLGLGGGLVAMGFAADYFAEEALWGLLIAAGLPSVLGLVFVGMGMVGLQMSRKPVSKS